MYLLFHGAEYAGQGHTVTVLAFALLAAAVGMPVHAALASIERPREIFWLVSLGAALTLALSGSLVFEWGAVGISYACLVGEVAQLAASWLVFLAVVPRCSPTADPVSSSGSKRPPECAACKLLEYPSRPLPM
jgi:O-antigen/teichoic acid export membrane protein